MYTEPNATPRAGYGSGITQYCIRYGSRASRGSTSSFPRDSRSGRLRLQASESSFRSFEGGSVSYHSIPIYVPPIKTRLCIVDIIIITWSISL